MSNGDLLIPASLQSQSTSVVYKQQDASKAVPAEVVSGEQSKGGVNASSGVAKQELQAARKGLQEKVAQLNEHMQQLNRNLSFSVDDASGVTVVKVVDTKTEEVIRQIPTQEVLDARNAAEKYRGLLLQAKV